MSGVGQVFCLRHFGFHRVSAGCRAGDRVDPKGGRRGLPFFKHTAHRHTERKVNLSLDIFRYRDLHSYFHQSRLGLTLFYTRGKSVRAAPCCTATLGFIYFPYESAVNLLLIKRFPGTWSLFLTTNIVMGTSAKHVGSLICFFSWCCDIFTCSCVSLMVCLFVPCSPSSGRLPGDFSNFPYPEILS